MHLLMIIFYVILIVLGVSFSALNAQTVLLNLYITTLKLPISVLVIISLAIGILAGLLLFIVRYWRLKLSYLKLKHRLKGYESQTSAVIIEK